MNNLKTYLSKCLAFPCLKHSNRNVIFNNKRLFSVTSVCKQVEESEEYPELLKSYTNGVMSYATSVSGFPNLTNNIRELIDEKAKLHGDFVAYNFMHQGIGLTYSELKERVDATSQNYLNLGFKKGDRIAFALPNTIELLVSTLAAANIGLISTLLNPAYQITEFEYMLKKSGAKGLVIYDSFKVLQHMKVIQHICPEINSCAPGELKSEKLPDLKHVFVLNSPLSPEKHTYNGTWQFSELSEKKSQITNRELPYIDLDDPMAILFTSGTLGRPKGALLSQGGLINVQHGFATVCGGNWLFQSGLVGIPFFHVFGYGTGVIFPLTAKGMNVFPFYFPDTLMDLKAIQYFKTIIYRGTPTQIYDILNHPEREKYDLSSLQAALIGGSALSPDLIKRSRKQLNIKHYFLGFGMTETSLGHMSTQFSDKKKGDKYYFESCGRTFAHCESKIVNPVTGETQPLNVEGELYCRGYNVIKKYWDEPEKTKETIDENGWLKTGDIFSMDKDGYLYFKSRIKDVIIRGGANIYPAEIEDFLVTHPEINNIQAFGVPSERHGEEVAAWIILENGSTLTEDLIREFCKGKISHFKIPRYIKFVESFPRNANNKILKAKMRESAAVDFSL